MKNVHVLATDKPSRLYLTTHEYIFEEGYSLSTDECENKHIYITSDEEIRVGDWVYNIVSKNIFKASKQLIDLIDDPNVTLTTNKKIILTTDQDLIKDGVQAIDDEFLEWFVKNPSCEKIIVNSIQTKPLKGFIYNFEYKIIIPKEDFDEYHYKETFESRQYYIPKEEPKQDCFLLPDCTCKEPDFDVMKGLCKICGNSIIHLGKRIKVNKQETLEEVAKRLYQYQSENPPYTIITPKAKIEGFIEGAIWQQEQDKNKFSNEEVLDVLREFYKTFDPIKNPPQTSTIPLWFEQFKNK